MSYTGYVPFLCEYAAELFKQKGKTIRILEIGVLQGTTTFPLASNLAYLNIPYSLDAVDILVRPEVRNQKAVTMGLEGVSFIEENSLVLLKKLCIHNAGLQEKYRSSVLEPHPAEVFYDIVLVDGDHNFKTVAQECEFLQLLTHHHTIFLFDDVDSTKHGGVDIYYADMTGYENNKLATPAPETAPKEEGVRNAVNRFQVQTGYIGWKFYSEPPRLVTAPDNDLFINWVSVIVEEDWPRIQHILTNNSCNERPVCFDISKTVQNTSHELALPRQIAILARRLAQREKEKE